VARGDRERRDSAATWSGLAVQEVEVRARKVVTREGQGVTAGMHKPKEKVPFGKCAKASRVGWAE
jgi:hypothetical protein